MHTSLWGANETFTILGFKVEKTTQSCICYCAIGTLADIWDELSASTAHVHRARTCSFPRKCISLRPSNRTSFPSSLLAFGSRFLSASRLRWRGKVHRSLRHLVEVAAVALQSPEFRGRCVLVYTHIQFGCNNFKHTLPCLSEWLFH